MPPRSEWHFVNLLFGALRFFNAFKISEYSWLLSMDLDNSVFVSLLEFFGFLLDNWIIDIVKV